MIKISFPIEDMGLSIRTYSILYSLNIKTLEDITNLTELEFLNLRNIDGRSLTEVKEALDEFGLSFKDE